MSLIEAASGAAAEVLKARGFSDQEIEFAVSNLGMAPGQPNLNTLTDGFMGLRHLDVQAQRAVALGDEHIPANVPRYNQLTALQNDKPYEPVRVASGNMMPSGIALGDEAFRVMPTPEALARIERSEALTRQGQQRTDAAVDKRRAGSQGGRGGKSASEEIIAQARERIAAGRSAKEVADHLISKGYPQEAKKIYSGK